MYKKGVYLLNQEEISYAQYLKRKQTTTNSVKQASPSNSISLTSN